MAENIGKDVILRKMPNMEAPESKRKKRIFPGHLVVRMAQNLHRGRAPSRSPLGTGCSPPMVFVTRTEEEPDF
jgi:hypothetical protein